METQNDNLVEEFMNANAEVNGLNETTENKAVEPSTEDAVPDPVNADPMPEEDEEEDEQSAETSAQQTNTASEETSVPKKHISNRKAKRLVFEVQSLRKQVEELKAAQAPKEDPQTQEVPKPVRSNFTSDEEYLDALSKWNVAKGFADQNAYAAKVEEARQKSELFKREWSAKIVKCFTQKEEQEAWDEHCREGAPTLMEMVGPDLARYLYSIEDGPKVQMYLWEHPRATERLANAHPMEQAEMIRNIRSFVGRPTQQKPIQQVAQPKPFGSVRTGKGTVPETTIENASAEELFDMLIAK